MQKTIQVLAVLLVLQLAVAAGLQLRGGNLSAPTEPTALLGVNADQIDRLTLEGPDNAKVVLAKVDGQWRLPEVGDFPADQAKVGQLITRLGELKYAAPVATTAAALERFKVSDAAFERRITLAAGEQALGTLYLGTSPGMRQIHARNATQDAVFTVDFAAYDAPVKAEDWQDKTLLQIPVAEIEAIEVGDLKLARSAPQAPAQPAGQDKPAESGAAPAAEAAPPAPAAPAWTASGLAEGETLQPAAADKLADALATLRIDSVLGKEAKPEYGLDEPALTLALTRKGGAQVQYAIGKSADKEEYTLKVSTREEYFRLAAYTATSLVDAAKRQALAAKPTPDSEPAPTSSAEPGNPEQPPPLAGD